TPPRTSRRSTPCAATIRGSPRSASRSRRPTASGASRISRIAGGSRAGIRGHTGTTRPEMAIETADVVVIGTGFRGAIAGYYLAAAGARVVFLERGPRFRTEQFAQNLRLGSVPIVDVILGDGIDVLAGNCVGGSSVVYFAASLRVPSLVFERTGTLGR